MPILEPTYKPSFPFKNGFISTVYSGLLRQVRNIKQERERIKLCDGDFLDLDWSYANVKTDQVIVLFHGLEGHGQRPYVTGVAKLFNDRGVDAVCVNFRGCSGEDNLMYKSYHSGATEDMEEVVAHLIQVKHYSSIYLKGISLGANMILKYLGERDDVPNEVKAAIAVSVPCYLYGSAKELLRLKNKLYHDRFKKYLIHRLKNKQQRFKHILSEQEIASIKTLIDFDEVYTAKAHGFKNAIDYYEKASCLQYLHNITTPTLIINALKRFVFVGRMLSCKRSQRKP